MDSNSNPISEILARILPSDKLAAATEKHFNNFNYHSPTGEAREKFVAIRTYMCGVASAVEVLCPNSREKSLALTKIEEAMMWANASIARLECPTEEASPPAKDEKSDASRV